jgi:membrane protein DedA with SNARE-associated domain
MNAFEQFTQQLEIYGYPLLFGGVLLENAGIPLPGETAVVVAGFLSSPAGGSHFNLLSVILTVFIAAVIGDNLGFWLGHRYARPRLANGKGFLILTPKTLELAEGYFKHYGVWTVFFARFIAGLRIVGALAAGTAGMHWTHFLAANAAGALTWATAISVLGYFFGHSWELLHHMLGRGALIIAACIAILVGLRFLLHHYKQSPKVVWETLARRQIWQGVVAAILEAACIALLVHMAQRVNPTRLDQHIDEFLTGGAPHGWFDSVARAVSYLGSLPAAVLAVGITIAVLRYYAWSWRPAIALVAALVVSEIAGLCLLELLRRHDVEPSATTAWPADFAGMFALRAMAVYGLIGHILPQAFGWRQVPAQVGGVLLAVLTGAGVLWLGEQRLTEIGLELVAGGLVLFAVVWWLEGLGLGLVAPEPRVDRPPEHSTISV